MAFGVVVAILNPVISSLIPTNRCPFPPRARRCRFRSGVCRCVIGTRTGLCPATSAPGPESASARGLGGSPSSHHIGMDWTLPCKHQRWDLAHPHKHITASARIVRMFHAAAQCVPDRSVQLFLPPSVICHRGDCARIHPDPSRQRGLHPPSAANTPAHMHTHAHTHVHTHARAHARATAGMPLRRSYASRVCAGDSPSMYPRPRRPLSHMRAMDSTLPHLRACAPGLTGLPPAHICAGTDWAPPGPHLRRD